MDYIIANPPAGIYKGDINIGYAFYHVLLDVHARYIKSNSDLNIIAPRFSLNVFGRRAENIMESNNEKDFRNEMDLYVNDWILKNRLRDRLNLSFDGILLDNDIRSINEAQLTFSNLWNNNYILRIDNQYFLDLNKIRREINLESLVEKIDFCPDRSRREFMRLIKENTKKLLKISSPTKYSAKNPLGGDNLSPLFVISSFWEAHYNNGLDLLAIGDKGLVRYGLLRFIIRAATNKDPLTKKIFCFNKIDPEGGFENWNVDDLTKNIYEADILRYALIKSHSLNSQKIELKKSLLSGGRNFIYLIGNLGKFFSCNKDKIEINNEHLTLEEQIIYNNKMDNFKFNESLNDLEIKIKNLSKIILKSKEKILGETHLLSHLYSKYSEYIKKLKPFVPAIAETSEKRIKK